MSPPRLVPRRQSTGLTLIECLVACTLVALLATLGLPSFDTYLQRRQVEGLSAQLLADLQFLRTATVARGEQLRLRVISPATGPGGCYVVHTGAADACRCDGETAACRTGDEALRVAALPAQSRARLTANVASMLVDPRLGTVSPTGSIDIAGAQGDALRHVVSLLGRARVCVSAGRWPGVPAC